MTTTISPPLRSYAPVRALEYCPESGRALVVRMASGRVAYYMRSRSDCFRATLALAADVPYETVPDTGHPEMDGLASTQMLADLGAWAQTLGYRLVWHRELPLHRLSWIGAVEGDEHGPSHCGLFCGERVVFDPASNWPLPAGEVLIPLTLADVSFAVTLDRIPDHERWR